MNNFTVLLKYLCINPVSETINKPQANASVEQMHQVIYKIMFTKDIDKKVLTI